MQCPVDGETLVMADRNGVEIDYCPRCRGVWLDRGELDKIIDRAAGGAAPAPAQARAPHLPRRRNPAAPPNRRRSISANRNARATATMTTTTSTRRSARKASSAISSTSDPPLIGPLPDLLAGQAPSGVEVRQDRAASCASLRRRQRR